MSIKDLNVSVSHILVSPSEKIVYVSCRAAQGEVQLFCIYDNKQVKAYNGEGWQVVNQVFSQKIIRLADQSIYKKPTFSVQNIVSQFVN